MMTEYVASGVVGLRGDKVLITGAGGFIGSHLTEEVVRCGADVVALVRYNSGNHWGYLEELDPEIRRSVNVVAGDVRDAEFVRSIMKGRTLVFHLAALVAVPYSYRSPGSYVATNVDGTLNVLQAAIDVGVERIVHTSSSEVYGTATYVPIDETHVLQAQSPYAASKIAGDKLAESFYHSFGLPVVTVRPFNAFGPRQSARAIVPTIATQALAGGPVRLGNLTPVRDLCFVTDTVRGFVLAATTPAALGQVINLCTGVGVSMGDLAVKILEAAGVRTEVQVDPQRVRPAGSEVEKLVGSAALAHELLGWTPRVDLEEGLARTVGWLRAHADRYKSAIYNM